MRKFRNLYYRMLENKLIYTIWWKVRLFKVDQAAKRADKKKMDSEAREIAWEDQMECWRDYHFEKKMGATW